MDSDCKVTPRPKTLKGLFRSWYFWKPFLSISIGGIAGFLYYYFIGCTSGTCAITSNPYGSIIMGSFLGFFLISSPCLKCR